VGFQAGTRETIARVKRHAQVWRQFSSGPATDHLIIPNQRQCGGIRVGRNGGASYEIIQNQIEGEISRETREQVLLKRMHRVDRGVVRRVKFGPRPRLGDHGGSGGRG
jgi:hypothetical protein